MLVGGRVFAGQCAEWGGLCMLSPQLGGGKHSLGQLKDRGHEQLRACRAHPHFTLTRRNLAGSYACPWAIDVRREHELELDQVCPFYASRKA